MSGPFQGVVDVSHPGFVQGLGHSIADEIQAAHARGLADELIGRQKLIDQFHDVEADTSYDPKARAAARNYGMQLKFLKPTDKRPKQFQPDKNGQVQALTDVLYRHAMANGVADPAQPAPPQDPSAGGGPPASISAMPDFGLGGGGAGSGSWSGVDEESSGVGGGGGGAGAVPGGAQQGPNKISPAPAVAGASTIPPPPSIAAGGGDASSLLPPPPPAMPPGMPTGSIAPPPSLASLGLDPGQPPGTVSTKMSSLDVARNMANVKAIESMVPVSREQATELGVEGAPEWPGMPGMVAVHPKVLEGTRYMLDRQARLVSQGIDPETGQLMPWKAAHEAATIGLQHAQTEAQRMIAANKPKEAAALLMRANADMIAANAKMRMAQYNPYALLFGSHGGAAGGGGAGGNGSITPSSSGAAGGSGGPEDFGSDNEIKQTLGGRYYVDLSNYSAKVRDPLVLKYTAMGVPVVNASDASALHEIDGAKLNFSSIEQQLLGLLPKDAGGRPIGAQTNKLLQFFQADSYLAASGSWRTTAIKALRAAAGSKGFRMTEAEIQLAVDNDIPKITDTIGTAAQKIRNMQAQIDNAEAAMLTPRRIGMHGSRGEESTATTAAAPNANGNASVPPPADKREVGKTRWVDPKGILRVWNGVGWAKVKEQGQ